MLHSHWQLRTEKDGDTEKECQKSAVQQKTTDADDDCIALLKSRVPVAILHTPSLGGKLLALGEISGSRGCAISVVQEQSPWSGGLGRSPRS